MLSEQWKAVLQLKLYSPLPSCDSNLGCFHHRSNWLLLPLLWGLYYFILNKCWWRLRVRFHLSAPADLVGADEGVTALRDSPPSIFLQAESGKCKAVHLSPSWMASQPSLPKWRTALHLHQHLSRVKCIKNEGIPAARPVTLNII